MRGVNGRRLDKLETAVTFRQAAAQGPESWTMGPDEAQATMRVLLDCEVLVVDHGRLAVAGCGGSGDLAGLIEWYNENEV